MRLTSRRVLPLVLLVVAGVAAGVGLVRLHLSHPLVAPLALHAVVLQRLLV
jgi:hypothetical protein